VAVVALDVPYRLLTRIGADACPSNIVLPMPCWRFRGGLIAGDLGLNHGREDVSCVAEVELIDNFMPSVPLDDPSPLAPPSFKWTKSPTAMSACWLLSCSKYGDTFSPLAGDPRSVLSLVSSGLPEPECSPSFLAK
jgi:hypothetical protein